MYSCSRPCGQSEYEQIKYVVSFYCTSVLSSLFTLKKTASSIKWPYDEFTAFPWYYDANISLLLEF